MSFLRPDGTSDVAAAVRLMMVHPSRIPGMVRLARDSSMAASKAARVRYARRRMGSLSAPWGRDGLSSRTQADCESGCAQRADCAHGRWVATAQ